MARRTKVIIAVAAGLALLAFAIGLIIWAFQPSATISVQTEPLPERPGAAIVVTGARFPANREIYVGLSEPDVPPMAGTSFVTARTDSAGKFQVTFPFPVDPMWANLPEVTVYAGTPDGSVVATTRLSLSSIALLLTPAPVSSATPSPTASATLLVPSATVTASPTASATPLPTAVPIPAISLNPPTGRVGTAVVVTGQGWRADETLLISLLGYDTQSAVSLGTIGTDAQGNLAATFIFPTGWTGPSVTLVFVHSQDNSEQATAAFQVIGLATPTVATPTPLVITGWLGQYYSNQTLSGAPALARNDDNIDFDWGSSSPAPGVIPDDHFSARWTRTIYFLPGGYRFWAIADDGVRVWLDNQLLIDEWHLARNTQYTADVTNLAEGQHTLRVEYYEEAGMAKVRFGWQQLPTPTPTSTSTPTPTATATVPTATATVPTATATVTITPTP
jgi:hypothetical protein